MFSDSYFQRWYTKVAVSLNSESESESEKKKKGTRSNY